jgi:Fe-S-cluster-containing dehydrogenase component
MNSGSPESSINSDIVLKCTVCQHRLLRNYINSPFCVSVSLERQLDVCQLASQKQSFQRVSSPASFNVRNFVWKDN